MLLLGKLGWLFLAAVGSCESSEGQRWRHSQLLFSRGDDNLVQPHLHILHILQSLSHMKVLSFLTCVGLGATFPVAISSGCTLQT
ncbi:hypothetical protein M758_8G166400 [Ceratodon purpureus]|nr:hypothetical protein M758_8G166400 [Ceratodon purpureus]